MAEQEILEEEIFEHRNHFDANKGCSAFALDSFFLIEET